MRLRGHDSTGFINRTLYLSERLGMFAELSGARNAGAMNGFRPNLSPATVESPTSSCLSHTMRVRAGLMLETRNDYCASLRQSSLEQRTSYSVSRPG